MEVDMTTALIPFGVRAERQPYTIDVDGSTFAYDYQRPTIKR
jgi:hypothetical protein